MTMCFQCRHWARTACGLGHQRDEPEPALCDSFECWRGPKGATEGKVLYLASPYSHPDPAVRQQRYEQVLEATRLLMLHGHLVWAPIVYTHHLAEAGLPTDWGFWEAFDRAMLSRCDALWVLALDGWLESKGVDEEIGAAWDMRIPVLVRPGDIEPLRLLVEGHPIGCVCAECEREQVREAMSNEGGV